MFDGNDREENGKEAADGSKMDNAFVGEFVGLGGRSTEPAKAHYFYYPRNFGESVTEAGESLQSLVRLFRYILNLY